MTVKRNRDDGRGNAKCGKHAARPITRGAPFTLHLHPAPPPPTPPFPRRARSDAALLSSFALLLLNALIALVSASSDYSERLLLRPLPQNTLLASFNFRSNESIAAYEAQNFRYFPRSFGQILQHAHAKELHLRFSVGRWDADNWGQRPWNGAREGGTGVELWAWVEADTEDEYASSKRSTQRMLIVSSERLPDG